MKTSPIASYIHTRYLLSLLLCCINILVLANSSLAFPITPHTYSHTLLAYTVSGTVYDDYNQNGSQDSRDPGLNGIIVTAYKSDNTSIVTTTTSTIGAALGQYTLNIPSGTGPVRIEFTNYGPGSSDPILAGFQSSNHTGGTNVAFVTGNQTSNIVNLGIERPSEYCQSNPQLVTTCYIAGNQNSSTLPVLVNFPYNATSTTTNPTVMAVANQLGTTWGLSYRRSSDSLFVGAFMKRYADFKYGATSTISPGSIYLLSNASTGSPTVNASPFVTLAAGTNPRNSSTNYAIDPNSYDAVGKMSLGGMALSEDENTLYVMNLSDKSLYRIPVGISSAQPAPGTITSFAVPVPSDCPSSDMRPFAVSSYRGTIYVGTVCSAESTQDATKLKAYIFAYTPSAGFNNTPIFQFSLHYTRGCAALWLNATCRTLAPVVWQPWSPTYNPLVFGCCSVYAQPILSSIAFDNGDLILGLRDRYGDQSGYYTYPPSGLSGGTGQGIPAGDTLRACLNTAGQFSSGWTLESNGLCGDVQTSGKDNGQGPGTGTFGSISGNGEYYYQDNLPYDHDDVGMGGLLQIPGFPGVMTTAMDPVTLVAAGGTHTYSNTNGARLNQYQIYRSPTSPSTFGKASGLGTLVAFCQSAPVEIGNRVWLDNNNNGLQDASELGISGVTVHLYAVDGTTLLQTTTTDSNGEYYFTIPPYNNYVVKLDNPGDYASGGPLNGDSLSVSNQGSDNLINSKANLPNTSNPLGTGNYPQMAVTAPQPGGNTYTYDAGFVPPPDLSIVKSHVGTNFQSGQSITYSLQVANAPSAGWIPSGPVIVTDTIPAGLSNIAVNGTNWTFASASPSFRFATNTSFVSSSKMQEDVFKPHLLSSTQSVPDSPVTITATYTGPFPIPNGVSLSPIIVSATLTNAAISSLQNTASVTVNGDGNLTNNTSIDIVAVAPAPDAALTISHSFGNTCVPLGQITSYTLTVSNATGASPIAVGPVLVNVTFPPDLSNITATGVGWTTSISGNILTATYAIPLPLAAGNSLPILTLSGIVNTNAGGSLNISGAVSVPGDINSSNDNASDTITTCPPPDLAISKSHSGSGDFQVGQNVSYQLVVSNVGSGNVEAGQDVTVTDSLPIGLSNVQASGTNWSISHVGASLIATYTGSYPITPTTQIAPIIVSGTLLSTAVAQMNNTATVATLLDRNAVNNIATDSLLVNPAPDLTIVKTHQGTGPFQVGQTLSYILSVSNIQGSGSLLSGNTLTVVDPLPSSLVSVIANGTNWIVTVDAHNSMTATYSGSFPIVGGSILPDIVVSGQLTNNSVPQISNTASVSAPDDTNITNNSSTDTINVVALPDLLVNLTHTGFGCVNSGDITYTLDVSNASNAGPVLGDYPIRISMIVPDVLDNVAVNVASGWNASLSGNTITATYAGSYPLIASAHLPALIVTGFLSYPNNPNPNATVNLILANDSNTNNNSATENVMLCGPDLFISRTNLGTRPFQIGQAFSFALSVTNKTESGPVFAGRTITVTDHLPLGLGSPIASGTNWTTTIVNGTLTATYSGSYPVFSGTNLPNIVVSGQVTTATLSTLGNIATVTTPGDVNLANNSLTSIVPVLPLPDLTLHLIHTGSACSAKGLFSYILTVTNNSSSGPVLFGQPIIIHMDSPMHFNAMQVKANDKIWQVGLRGNIWTMTYLGSYPIPPGGSLASVTITGQPLDNSVTLSATITTYAKSDMTNDTITLCKSDHNVLPKSNQPLQITNPTDCIYHRSNSISGNVKICDLPKSGNARSGTNTNDPGNTQPNLDNNIQHRLVIGMVRKKLRTDNLVYSYPGLPHTGSDPQTPIFHLAEFAILTHLPLRRLPSPLGSPQAVLQRFGLSP